jgi:pteridine reductase
MGVQARAVAADLEKPDEIRRMFDGVKRLDVLVNSAAIFERVALGDISVEAWDRMIAINLRAPFLCCQAAVPLMADGGHIVNIVDVGGLVAWPNYSHYISAKAGLAMLTRSLALELAPKVRVNGVAPGTVLWSDAASEEEKRRVTSRIPLGRIGTPEDIARTVVFLTSGPDFITGQVLAVDGGRSVNTGGV